MPHARLTARNLKHFKAGSGVGYIAELHLDDDHVGFIVNPLGTTTTYQPLPGTPMTLDAMNAYAGLCRHDEQTDLTPEDVLNTLIDEGETAALVHSITAAGDTPLRLVRSVHGRRLDNPPVGIGAPAATPAQQQGTANAIHRRRTLQAGESYEVLVDGAWHRLPPPDGQRPAER